MSSQLRSLSFALAVGTLAAMPLAADAAAPTLSGDTCTFEPRTDIDPAPGLPPEYLLNCAGSRLGSVSAYAAHVPGTC